MSFDSPDAEAFASMMAEADSFADAALVVCLRLEAVVPELVLILQSRGGQGERVRQILWSLFGATQLVPLGEVLVGLDYRVARVVEVALQARLYMGADCEEILREALEQAGEFAHYKEFTTRQGLEGTPQVYPLPRCSAEELPRLAEALNAEASG